MSERRDIKRLILMGNALTAIIILVGIVAGTWKRILKNDTIEIRLNPLKKLDKAKLNLVKEAAGRYGEFWKKGVSILV